MNNSDLILIDREKRILEINKYIDNYHVVTLKANIPGPNKNINEAFILLDIFNEKILDFKPLKSFFIDGSDGRTYIYLFPKDTYLKEEMIKLEETKLGRFVDIDCFYKSNISIQRNIPRRCYICDNDARICNRLKKHSIKELLTFIKESIKSYFVDLICESYDFAIKKELDLDPKFGLVTRLTNGSHKDMNYDLMIKSSEAIKRYFIMMFEYTYKNKTIFECYKKSKELGILAEKEMFKTTNGINTYKGLIFSLGLIITAFGYIINNYNIKENIFDLIKFMASPLKNELGLKNTNGDIAYKEHNLGGARFEAINGYKTIYDYLIKNDNIYDSDIDITNALAYFIYNIDDTVLYKRAKTYEKYLYIKNIFKDYKYDLEYNKKITLEFINDNISFGGAADMLVSTIFIKRIDDITRILL